ncbi:MAG: hypothetical protein K6T91_09140 [Firmicutes bacterium]|nr:hypothetical protein [Bacillota bacterium]
MRKLGGFGTPSNFTIAHFFGNTTLKQQVARLSGACHLIMLGIGSLWGFIEGILILVGTINKDASSVPLKD